jgi:hypothetical protein
VDNVKAGYAGDIVFNGPTITGFYGSGFKLDNTLIEGETQPVLNPQSYFAPATTGYDPATGVLTARNSLTIPPNHVFYINFKVTYKDVKPGTIITNDLGDHKVSTLTPLEFSLKKVNEDGTAGLSGAKFKVVYADANGATNIPVRDVDGQEIAGIAAGDGTTPGNLVRFYPDTTKGNSYQIALVETLPPADLFYADNAGKTFIFTVTKTTLAGRNVWGITGANNAADVAINADGSLITVKNKSGEPAGTISIHKYDASQNLNLADVEFVVDRVNKTDLSVITNAYATYRTDSQGNIDNIKLPLGAYHIYEKQAPKGYYQNMRASFYVEVKIVNNVLVIDTDMNKSSWAYAGVRTDDARIIDCRKYYIPTGGGDDGDNPSPPDNGGNTPPSGGGGNTPPGGGGNTPPDGNTPNLPPIPLTPGNTLEPGPDGSYLEIGPDGVPTGAWHWDDPKQEWVYDEFPPLGGLNPHTGQTGLWLPVGTALLIAGVILTRRLRVKAAKDFM